MSTFVLHTNAIFVTISIGWSTSIFLNLSWMRLKMSYHRLNNLAELLNVDLSAKIRRGILYRDLMDRECNCYLTYKVNGKCIYDVRFWNKCLIYKIKCLMSEAIYIGNIYQTYKKRMDGNFSNLLCLIKNRPKPDSFSAHFKQNFNATTSRTYLRKYMTFRVVCVLTGLRGEQCDWIMRWFFQASVS